MLTILGIIVSVILLGSEISVFVNDPDKALANKDLSDEEQQSENIFQIDHTAINSVVQINVEHELHVIMEVLLPGDGTWSCAVYRILPESHFLKTLFRQIISPNAP